MTLDTDKRCLDLVFLMLEVLITGASFGYVV